MAGISARHVEGHRPRRQGQRLARGAAAPRSPHVRFLNRLGGRLLVFVWVGDTVNSKAIVWRWAAACGGWDSLAYPSHDGIGGGSGRDPPRGEHYRCTRAS
ncbi:MAG: hypothetical protein ACRDQI_11830, partial [Pseudonocardiaceae bacterium]